MLKIQLCITGINYFIKHIQTVIVNCNNISHYYCFYCIFTVYMFFTVSTKYSLGEHKILLS